MEQVLSVDGDRIDLICWKRYGSLDGRIVERVLEANPGLSLHTELSAGVPVNLPDIHLVVQEQRLW